MCTSLPPQLSSDPVLASPLGEGGTFPQPSPDPILAPLLAGGGRDDSVWVSLGCGTSVRRSNITEGTDQWASVDFDQIKGSPSTRSPGPCMHIFMTTLSGMTVTLEVASADPVGVVKLALHVKVGVPPAMQRLLYAGKQLEVGRTLTDYGVHKESTLPWSCAYTGVSSMLGRLRARKRRSRG